MAYEFFKRRRYEHLTEAEKPQWREESRQWLRDQDWLDWIDSESEGRALFPYDPTYHKNQFHIHHDNLPFYAETRRDAAWLQFMMTS